MDTAALRDAFDRVAKKQKTVYASTQQCIDALIHQAQQAIAALAEQPSNAAAPEPASEALSDLGKKLNDLAVAGQAKELHGALSKFGKIVERSFLQDIHKATRDKEFDKELLNEAIAQHLFREGRFQLGHEFVEEAGVKLPPDYTAPYLAMYNILAHIQRRDLAPALLWAAQHRDQLAKRSSLEFKLHALQFVQELQARGRATALAYARREFGRFALQHLHDIQRLMGCLLWAGRLQKSPYADLLQESHWDYIAQEFMRECCNLAGESYESPLYVTITAGAAALPTLVKLAGVMAAKNTLASKNNKPTSSLMDSEQELPVEIALGREFQFHSIFSCPVSRELGSAENPPMLLPCGHVLCKQSAAKLAKGSTRTFKCPYCPQDTTVAQCKEVKF
eukprot:jgi/Chlat1/7938/Chrsp68S07376